MKRAFRLTAVLAMVAVALLASATHISAQEKRGIVGTRANAPGETREKEGTAGARAPENDREKRIPTEAKSMDEGDRTRGQANDYWTTCYGGFHMFGSQGHAVYRFPASSTGTGYDTNWEFVDDYSVGGRQGWTYKEQGYRFYVFFARYADSNGKFWVGYSGDNQSFRFYAWAD